MPQLNYMLGKLYAYTYMYKYIVLLLLVVLLPTYI